MRRKAGPYRRLVPIGLACLVTTCLSGWSLRQEGIVHAVNSAVEQDQSGPPARLALDETTLPAGAPARAMLLEALHIGTVVSANPDMPGRAVLLARARLYIDRIEGTRQHWGEMWVVKAFLYSLSTKGFSPVERDALVRSYLDAAYLHATGRWRAQRALYNWNALPPFTRERVAREVVWLYLTSSGGNPLPLLQAARDSDGYVAVFTELRNATR